MIQSKPNICVVSVCLGDKAVLAIKVLEDINNSLSGIRGELPQKKKKEKKIVLQSLDVWRISLYYSKILSILLGK